MKKNLTLYCALAASLMALPAFAQFTISDVGSTSPTPGVNDVYAIFDSVQNNDGLNYYWDNIAGQTFTTGPNSGGYTLTSLAIKTAGGGGGWGSGAVNTWSATQTFTVTIYSIDGGGNATPVATNTAVGGLSAQGNWMRWNGLSVPLAANTLYAYTFHDDNSNPSGGNWEQLANNGNNPYANGQICRIPAGGGVVQYGNSGVSDATFNLGLALGTVAGGTVTIADIGTTAPTPGANDISQLTPAVVPMQNNYGLNYYWDSNPGQTFTTPASSLPWVMTNLVIKSGGNGGGGWNGSQAFVLRIYSVSGSTASLIYSNSCTSALTAQGNWLQCSGMNVVLQPNQQYAYGFNRGANGSWEQMANYDGNPYAGGKICLINPVSGAINYGTQAATGSGSSDAAFDVGLTAPLVLATIPTYTPNVSPIYAGTMVTLNEAPVGTGTLSYQWQTDGGSGGSLTNIPGETSSNLIVSTTGFAVGTYNYAVVVTTTAGGGMSSTSPTLPLSVIDASAPVLVSDTTPAPNVTASFEGLSQAFSASFNGTLPIGYQWYVATDSAGTGAASVSGATNTTLTLTNLQLGNTGFYALVATNVVSPYNATSTWAQLTVQSSNLMLIHWQTPVTFNSLTSGQILTNTLPGNFFEAAYFGNSTATVTVTNNSLTYNFYGDGSTISIAGQAWWSSGCWLVNGNTTGDTNLDYVLNQFAYDGSSGTHTITLHNLTPGSNYCVQIFALDDRAPGAGRYTTFQDPANNADVSASIGMQDNMYVVGTFTAPAADMTIQQNLLPGGAGNTSVAIVGTVGWTPAPLFLTQPASASAYPGRTVQFSATATGTPAPAYRWQVSTDGGTTFADLSDGVLGVATVSGSTNGTLSLAGVVSGNNGWMFRNTATNANGGVPSSAATLTMLSVPPESGANGTQILALNPVAYWPFNETTDPSSGSLAAYEAAGMHDGTYGSAAQDAFNGIVGPQLTDGIGGFAASQGAVGLSGTANSWVSTPALNLNTNNATITCWVKPTGIQVGYSALLMNRNSGSAGGLHFRDNNELGYTWVLDNAAQWGHSTGLYAPADQWAFCALVITPTNTTWYLYTTNGGMQTHVYTINNPVMPWTGSPSLISIGRDPGAGSSRVVNGVIDEVAVFNYSLNSNQVAYAAGISTSLVNTDPATANFTANLSGQTLNFSWATDHQGWQLYTNSVGLMATNSWHPIPGSANVHSQSVTVDPANPNVFFQLRYP